MTTFDVTEEWQTVRIPFAKTTFDWKGQEIKNMPKLKPEVLFYKSIFIKLLDTGWLRISDLRSDLRQAI